MAFTNAGVGINKILDVLNSCSSYAQNYNESKELISYSLTSLKTLIETGMPFSGNEDVAMTFLTKILDSVGAFHGEYAEANTLIQYVLLAIKTLISTQMGE